jgi:hypothetical protein
MYQTRSEEKETEEESMQSMHPPYYSSTSHTSYHSNVDDYFGNPVNWKLDSNDSFQYPPTFTFNDAHLQDPNESSQDSSISPSEMAFSSKLPLPGQQEKVSLSFHLGPLPVSNSQIAIETSTKPQFPARIPQTAGKLHQCLRGRTRRSEIEVQDAA